MLWIELVEKAIPAVTSSTASGQGLDYVAAFISACAGRVSYSS